MAVKAETAAAGARHAKGTGAAYVYERLRAEILDLALAPGETLDEAGLVRRFGLSRTPVREALIRLASDGLVAMLPNRGAQVASLDLTGFPRYVEALDLLQRVMTRLAALRRSDGDLETIARARDAFEAAVETGDPMVLTERNRDFHLAVAEAAHNDYLSPHYARLLNEGMRMLRIPFAYDPAGGGGAREHIAKIIAEHRAIVEAIAAGDAERADALAHAHTELFQSRFLQYLRQNAGAEIELEADGQRRGEPHAR